MRVEACQRSCEQFSISPPRNAVATLRTTTMPSDTGALVARCRELNLRVTGPRRVIADVLSASTDHPDVQAIHERVATINPKISLATVYRCLKLFAQHGMIESHAFDGKRARIERAADQHHDHLIDTTTHKIIEFRSDEIERLQREVARSLGYELTGHRLELYGRPIKRARRLRKR